MLDFWNNLSASAAIYESDESKLRELVLVCVVECVQSGNREIATSVAKMDKHAKHTFVEHSQASSEPLALQRLANSARRLVRCGDVN